MSARIRIDRLQLSGVDERTARAAMAQLPALLAQLLRVHSLADLQRPGLRVELRGSGPRDVARAIADALLRVRP